ncbi:MAG: hypothetical protein MJ107_06370 [Lachnospiraceae bacterium]|nr:hypothetical protein [Lachnospiraceae bacterium]
MLSKFWRLYVAISAFLIFLGVIWLVKVPVLTGIAFYSVFLFLLFLNNKKSVLRTVTMDNLGINGRIVTCFFALIMIVLCVLPMDLAPFWNGQIPMHRNQYELLADSILDGHLYIDYDDIDERLLAMENPYDYEERLKQEILYHWDHAFYKGHYYMYFGVVPVFVLFIPFKLIFGKTLVTFHATQFFVMFSIIAFFLLFIQLCKRFYKKMPLGTYLLTTMAVCMITLGYIVQAPALYCTAISGGIFFMLWSLNCYFYAVYFAKKEWMQVLLACLGAIFGALAFGCRPPVALANIIAIPLAITYAKNYKGKHIIRNFILIALPYVIIGALLMLYNYLRFENPFEFGQAYQLTSYDQTVYMSFFDRIDLFAILSGLFNNFFTVGTIESLFPHFFYGGLYITYPLMWLIVIYYSKGSVHNSMKLDKSRLLAFFIFIEPVIVTAVDTYWSPGLCERYRLDEYFIVGIFAFMLAGYRLRSTDNQERSNAVISTFAVASMLLAVLMFFYPCDANFADFFPEKMNEIRHILTFGLQ